MLRFPLSIVYTYEMTMGGFSVKKWFCTMLVTLMVPLHCRSAVDSPEYERTGTGRSSIFLLEEASIYSRVVTTEFFVS